jgi:hypothetical protein
MSLEQLLLSRLPDWFPANLRPFAIPVACVLTVLGLSYAHSRVNDLPVVEPVGSTWLKSQGLS